MTTNVNDQARRISYIQRQIADILDGAGRKVRQLEEAMSTEANSLERALTRRSKPISAKGVADAFAEFRVNTGELSSRLIDALERRGQKTFPTPYEPIRSTWALVENRP